MAKSIGVRDIARATGVSPATVSRVFNQHPNVREDVRQRVLAAAREMEYTAHRSARRTHVTVMVEGFNGLAHSHYLTATISALAVGLADAGYRPDIIPVPTESTIEIATGHYSVATLALVWSPALREQIKAQANSPIILINDHEPGWHCVRTDNRQGLRLAVDHLAERGHRRIALLRYYAGSWADRERLAGYHDALEQHGIAIDPDLIAAHNQTPGHDTQAMMLGLLTDLLRHQPTALILGSEDLGLPVLHALHAMKLDLPRELSLVAYECEGLSAYLQPPLTTIDQNPRRIAGAVVDMIAAIEDADGIDDTPRRTVLPNELIERYSVRRLTG